MDDVNRPPHRGWQVRRGEKGTQIELGRAAGQRQGRSGYADVADNARKGRNSGDDRPRLIHRVYTVFNAAQIDGIPVYAAREHSPFDVAQSGEWVLAGPARRSYKAGREAPSMIELGTPFTCR